MMSCLKVWFHGFHESIPWAVDSLFLERLSSDAEICVFHVLLVQPCLMHVVLIQSISH